MDIAIIGTGYVGLVSGVCLASKGHRVTCFDQNESVIEILQQGKCPIHEHGLENLMQSSSEFLSYKVLTSATELSLASFPVVIVAVGTPTVNGEIDLGQIVSVAQLMSRVIKSSEHFISVVIKSTVVPGTTDTVVRNILEKGSGKALGEFGLGMNPEFLREGNAVQDFLNADRVVLGYQDQATLDLLRKIYEPWECQKVELNTRSAEMMKYVNNTLLATLISSINEYSNIARSLGDIDFDKVMSGVHLDHRWTPVLPNGQKVVPSIIDYLKPGCGYGGSCFPKDVTALSALAKANSTPARIIDAVIDVNNNQPRVMVDMLKSKIDDLTDKRVLVLGLAFKPGTDDVRESVALKLLGLLNNQVASLTAHDPVAIENAKKHIDSSVRVQYIDDWKMAIAFHDIIIIATNWAIYESLADSYNSLTDKLIFDTRSMFGVGIFNDANYLSIN